MFKKVEITGTYRFGNTTIGEGTKGKIAAKEMQAIGMMYWIDINGTEYPFFDGQFKKMLF